MVLMGEWGLSGGLSGTEFLAFAPDFFFFFFFVTQGHIPRGRQTTPGCSLNFTKSLSVSISLGSALLRACVCVCVPVPTLSVASIK